MRRTDAAYYQITVDPEESGSFLYGHERVDGTSFMIDKPLQKGTYKSQVEAFNSSNQKLSESNDGIRFIVTANF